MTKEKILNGNKLIAKFMGYYPVSDGNNLDPEWWWRNDNGILICLSLDNPNCFKPHLAWGDLIPAVEMIEELDNVYDIEMHVNTCIIYSDETFEHMFNGTITNIWMCVVDFIEWNNQNK